MDRQAEQLEQQVVLCEQAEILVLEKFAPLGLAQGSLFRRSKK